MKNLWIGLLAASSVFAMDEYQPMAEGKTEIDVMYNYGMASEAYDVDGEAQDIGADITYQTITLGAKYGVIEGLDIELAVPYSMDKADFEGGSDDRSGLGQPSLGAKYSVTPEVATFLDLALPFGGEDIVGESPVMSFTLGGLHFLDAGEFSMISRLSLGYTLENDDKFQPGMGIDVLLKPSFAVSPELQLDLGVKYGMALDNKFDGEAMDDSGSNKLTVAPGVQYMIDDAMAIEANVGIDLMGKNAEKVLDIYAGFYYTM